MTPDFSDRKPQPNDAAAPRSQETPLSLESARAAAIEKLRVVFAELDHGEAPLRCWLDAPLTPNELIQAQVKERALPAVPPSPFRNVDPDPNALPFLSTIIEQPIKSALRWEAYTAFPSPREACTVAHALLKGGSKSRVAALSLLTQASFDDSLPGYHEALALTGQAFYVAARSGNSTDRAAAQGFIGLLFDKPDETWERAFTYLVNSVESAPDCDAQKAVLLTPLLEEKGPGAFCVLLGQALSRNTGQELSNALLSHLIANPLPGTRALTGLLQKILDATDGEARTSYSRLLSSIDGFCGEYWGHLAPWTFERPLRMLDALGLDPLDVHRHACPTIGLSSFLFACNLADCHPQLLARLDDGFKEKQGLSKSGNEWMTSGLRQQLIRCAFLSPYEHIEGMAGLLASDLRTTEGVNGCCHLLARLCVTQRREFPHLSVLRLRETAEEAAAMPEEIMLAVASAPDVSVERINEFVQVDPAMRAQEQFLAFSDSAPAVLQWAADRSWQNAALGLKPSPSRGIFASPPRGTSAIYEFVRAQTIHGSNPELLSLLGEALNEFERTSPEVFGAWRYAENNPVVARQLRSLTPAARASWKRGQLAFLTGDPVGNAEPHEELGGKAMYLALFTDEPEILFTLGKTPQFTAACTSYDSGSFYSKAIVSYLVDAHIRTVVLFDYAYIQRDIAPFLPPDFSEVVARGEMSFSLISKYAPFLLPAACERAVVKLGESTSGEPMLLLEPSFIRRNYNKSDNSYETLKFVAALAEKLGAGLAVRPYVNQTDFPLEEVILPPSRSPGGQIENHDFVQWIASHHGTTAISASIVLRPPGRTQ